MIRSKAKGVEDEPASAALILLLFTTGLYPFEQMAGLSPLLSTSAAARSKGVLGGQYRHCPCFGFVEMLEQEAKATPFYNVVNNSGC